MIDEEKFQHPGALGLSDAILEAGLEHRADALAQPFDAHCVDIEADDLVAGVGQTGGGHQPDVAHAYDTNMHFNLLCPPVRCRPTIATS